MTDRLHTVDNEPITLKEACDGKCYKVSTLRAEAARGRLVIFKLGRAFYTTRRRRRMARYRKKPVVIEAVRVTAADYNPDLPWDKAWDGCPFSEVPEWLREALGRANITPHNRGSTDYAGWDIHTLEGKMSATPGDWIIRGVKGELYPCKPDIFAATYEPAPPEVREE